MSTIKDNTSLINPPECSQSTPVDAPISESRLDYLGPESTSGYRLDSSVDPEMRINESDNEAENELSERTLSSLSIQPSNRSQHVTSQQDTQSFAASLSSQISNGSIASAPVTLTALASSAVTALTEYMVSSNLLDIPSFNRQDTPSPWQQFLDLASVMSDEQEIPVNQSTGSDEVIQHRRRRQRLQQTYQPSTSRSLLQPLPQNIDSNVVGLALLLSDRDEENAPVVRPDLLPDVTQAHLLNRVLPAEVLAQIREGNRITQLRPQLRRPQTPPPQPPPPPLPPPAAFQAHRQPLPHNINEIGHAHLREVNHITQHPLQPSPTSTRPRQFRRHSSSTR